jgi:hypothetical protein
VTDRAVDAVWAVVSDVTMTVAMPAVTVTAYAAKGVVTAVPAAECVGNASEYAVTAVVAAVSASMICCVHNVSPFRFR